MLVRVTLSTALSVTDTAEVAEVAEDGAEITLLDVDATDDDATETTVDVSASVSEVDEDEPIKALDSPLFMPSSRPPPPVDEAGVLLRLV